MDNEALEKKLNNSVRKLEFKIEHRKLYNVRNIFVRLLMKGAIALDYLLPFILAGIIVFNLNSAEGKNPFRKDIKEVKPSVETIDTTSGYHVEHISIDQQYSREALEYSTGWVVNEKGLYERTKITYGINDSINLKDVDKVLSMTKEELDNMLVITNIETISKSSLDPEDEIYNTSTLIVTNHKLSDEKIARMETTGEVLLDTFALLFLTLCWGNSLRIAEKFFVKTYIRDKIRGYEPLFAYIGKEKLETLKATLQVKKENLEMIQESQISITNTNLRLRKNQN